MSMDEKEYKKVCEFEDYLNNVCSHKTKILKSSEGEYFIVVRYNGALKKFFQNAKNYRKKITNCEANAIVKNFSNKQ